MLSIIIFSGLILFVIINDEHIIMAQEVGGPGLTQIDPENVTNQTLQGYPTEDKNMSTGLGNNLTN